MPASKAKLRYQKKYTKERCKNYCLSFSYKNCQDVIDYFTAHGCQNTVLKAVRKLIEDEKKINN